MDLRCILVAMVVYSSHGSTLYWSIAMSWLQLYMSQKYWCIVDAYSETFSDQADSHLEVTTCSLKALAYRIPLSLMLWGTLCYTQILSPTCDEILNTYVFPKSQTWSGKHALDVNSTWKNLAPPFPFGWWAVPCSSPPESCYRKVVPLRMCFVLEAVLTLHCSFIKEHKWYPW